MPWLQRSRAQSHRFPDFSFRLPRPRRQPGTSGISVFILSWHNPTASRGPRGRYILKCQDFLLTPKTSCHSWFTPENYSLLVCPTWLECNEWKAECGIASTDSWKKRCTWITGAFFFFFFFFPIPVTAGLEGTRLFIYEDVYLMLESDNRQNFFLWIFNLAVISDYPIDAPHQVSSVTKSAMCDWKSMFEWLLGETKTWGPFTTSLLPLSLAHIRTTFHLKDTWASWAEWMAQPG